MKIVGESMSSIPNHFSLEKFDNIIKEISSSKEELIIDDQINLAGYCEYSRFLQLIFSWSGYKFNNALVLPAEDEGSQAFREFASSLYGVSALNFCSYVVFKNGNKVSRRLAMEKSEHFVRKFYTKNISDIVCGDVAYIFNIDNAKKLKNNPIIYNELGKVRDKKEFSYIVRSILERICPDIKDGMVREKIGDISTFVYEAFLNTHDHARYDVSGHELQRSVRGVVFKYHDVLKENIVSESNKYPSLREYFSGWQLRPGEENLKFLEISVFDSGPGIVQTLLAKNKNITKQEAEEKSLSDQYPIIKKSFQVGQTSKVNPARGNGLPLIIGAIKSFGGAFMLRTGVFNLVNCFKIADDSDITEDDIRLEDYKEKGSLSRVPSACGTVISALIPLNKV
ncbi:hypothetical protein P8T57_04340 [Thalassospira sp. SN3W]|uniref:hypothetical protein n=1 Tax=Thalassospira sp. SN3W TaxID=3035476 RepID=UPI00311B387D